MNQQVRRRRVERHCSATIRALSSERDAEYRRQQLFLHGRSLLLQVPYLNVDVQNDPIARCRGVADAMAMRLIHSDRDLHLSLVPSGAIAKLIFDVLEQLRTESFAADALAGLQNNIDCAFDFWCRESRGNGLTENEIGLLIYAITQIVRSHLTQQLQDEEVEGLIESVRFRLSPLIGEDLVKLKRVVDDQRAFAKYALRIANSINEIAKSLGGDMLDKHFASLRSKNLLPPITDPDERYVESESGQSIKLDASDAFEKEYSVYCKDFDKQVVGSDLYRIEQRKALRVKLDKLIAAQAISVPRLAQRLKNLFAIEQKAGWHDGEEEGFLDGRRLSQIVARPGYVNVFKQEKQVPFCDTVVTFLIDNSGSMKRQRYEAVAVLVDVYCRALELAGIKCEILGFTTQGWTGGDSIGVWRKDGCPENPGRLTDRMHIVYKAASTSWRRSRYSISSMLNPVHFKEGLDGEALQWANQRLANRIESRKCLVMISDGAPMESATSNYNGEFYLERHLKNVVRGIEHSGAIELRAIGIALDMEEFFSQSITLDLTGTLGNRAFRALEMLFTRRHPVQ